MKTRQSPWQSSRVLHLVAESARSLALLVAFVLVMLFLSGGVAQLYLDWNSFEGGDLGGLVPGIDKIQAAWGEYQPLLREQHIPNTLWATLTGLSIGIVVGLALAALMDFTPILRWLLYPILILSQTIPIFAIAVLLILVFGFGFGPKIVVVALFCFYPITISTLSGFQSVDPLHTQLLRSMGANPLQVWWKVRLPAAMPAFFSGVRIAATYSVVGAVIGEYVGAGNGLGKFLQRSYQSYKSDQVFLAVTIIAVLSIGLVVFVTLIEFLALRWRYAGRPYHQNYSTRLIQMILALFRRLRGASRTGRLHLPEEESVSP